VSDYVLGDFANKELAAIEDKWHIIYGFVQVFLANK
jgi:hypothetical protein